MSISRVDAHQASNEGAWSMLQRLVRYFVDHGRLVQVITEQRYVKALRVDTDSRPFWVESAGVREAQPIGFWRGLGRLFCVAFSPVTFQRCWVLSVTSTAPMYVCISWSQSAKQAGDVRLTAPGRTCKCAT